MTENKAKSCLSELEAILSKYGASITAKDHWEGYAECGEDVRMTLEFDDYTLEDIDLGNWLDGQQKDDSH